MRLRTQLSATARPSKSRALYLRGAAACIVRHERLWTVRQEGGGCGMGVLTQRQAHERGECGCGGGAHRAASIPNLVALRWPGPGCWKCGAHVCSTTSRGVLRPPDVALQPTRQSSACTRARVGVRACVRASVGMRGAIRTAVRDVEYERTRACVRVPGAPLPPASRARRACAPSHARNCRQTRPRRPSATSCRLRMPWPWSPRCVRPTRRKADWAAAARKGARTRRGRGRRSLRVRKRGGGAKRVSVCDEQ